MQGLNFINIYKPGLEWVHMLLEDNTFDNVIAMSNLAFIRFIGEEFIMRNNIIKDSHLYSGISLNVLSGAIDTLTITNSTSKGNFVPYLLSSG